MQTALLISNVTTDDPGGRAADFATREDLFRKYGWEQIIGQVPEPYFRTFLPSLLRCYRQGRREDVDLVVSVSNPFHIQLVGFVVSLLLRVPWVVEFRDPMVTNPDRDPDALVTKIAGFVEWLCVTMADRVIWTDGMQVSSAYYHQKYPDVSSDQFVELPFKGYKTETFENADTHQYDQFTVTYAGSFYEGWIEPYSFLKGLNRYGQQYDTSLTVNFYGDWNEDYASAARSEGVSELLETYSFVPHEEIVPVLKGSDAVLYVGGTDSDNSENVPSKIWDYVGAQTPIIALVDPSFRVASLIRDHGLGVIADPTDPDAIAEAIHQIRSGEFEYDPEQGVFEQFSRETKIEAMAGVFDSVTGK